MTTTNRRIGAAAAVAVLAAVAIAAAQPPQKLSDTRLPNGLRVIISEDHVAPVFSIVVDYNVGSAAKKYWDPTRLQIVAVSDAAKLRDILAKFGTVEVYDSEGKPVVVP